MIADIHLILLIRSQSGERILLGVRIIACPTILLMKKLGLTEIDLEPYNSLGIAKYRELGIEYKLSGEITDPFYPAERLKQIRELFVPVTEN